MENTPDAAPVVPTSEATPNTNSNETAPVTPELSSEQVAKFFGTTAEQVDKFTKFLDSNGKFDKVFEKTKQTISNPQPKEEITQSPATSAPTQPTTESNPASAASSAPTQPADGFVTPTEIANLQYNKMLAEQYPELGEDYFKNGEYVKELTSMGVVVVDQNGYMNDKAIRQFLNLKKQTIPPTAPSAPVTSTPLVNYAEVDGSVDSREKAMQVMGQGVGHPQYQEAVKFMRESFFPAKKPIAPKENS